MPFRQPSAPPAATPSEDLLDSWKQIAQYLHRDIRTIQRWERSKGLPVHRLPGGDKPAVYALKTEVNAWRVRDGAIHSIPAAGAVRRPAPEVPTASVAVLPFANLSAEKDNEYFSDGLADEIITALTRVRGLRVTARTSSFVFRGQPLDVREIGSRLGVKALLEGSVQRSGGRLRISVQLVDVADGFHLWSEHYDRTLADIFSIQDEIAGAVAGALQVHLAPTPESRRAPSPEAYNQWLKGRYYQQQYEDLDALARSQACFERAIALDPAFPQPYLGLAAQAESAGEFGTIPPKELAARARAAIRKALELDDSLGEGYACAAAFRAWIDFDWAGAEADFARALALAPASSDTRRLRALRCLVPTNRLEAAEEEMNRAIELDPLSPLLHCQLGMLLNWKREFGRALSTVEAALALRPDYALAHWYRGAAMLLQGRPAEGLPFLQRAMEKLGSNPGMMGSIGLAFGYLGRQAEARAILAQLEAAAREGYVTPISRAWVYLGLGEFDAAFEWLRRAVEVRDPHILALPCKPIYDPLRHDPRFTALLREMRLE